MNLGSMNNEMNNNNKLIHVPQKTLNKECQTLQKKIYLVI